MVIISIFRRSSLRIRHCFFEARESKKHGINELCSAISQAAIYGTTHFAAAVGKLIAEVSGVVKPQSAACGPLLFGKNCAELRLSQLSRGQALDASQLYAFHRSTFAAGFILDSPDQSGNLSRRSFIGVGGSLTEGIC